MTSVQPTVVCVSAFFAIGICLIIKDYDDSKLPNNENIQNLNTLFEIEIQKSNEKNAENNKRIEWAKETAKWMVSKGVSKNDILEVGNMGITLRFYVDNEKEGVRSCIIDAKTAAEYVVLYKTNMK